MGAKTDLKRSSTTTFDCCFLGRRNRGSDLSLANRGSDILGVTETNQNFHEVEMTLDTRSFLIDLSGRYLLVGTYIHLRISVHLAIPSIQFKMVPIETALASQTPMETLKRQLCTSQSAVLHVSLNVVVQRPSAN